jgi:myo-inositol-1(or 4)-monophosphatase
VRHDRRMNALRPQTDAAIDFAQKALRRAAASTGAIHAKDGRDVVTDTDVAVEDMISLALSKEFGWPVVGEERGGEIRPATPYWLVDPICGTRNYASGIPLYAVNIALVEDGVVSVAVVGDGSTATVAAAERGGGAWHVRPVEHRLLASDMSATIDFEAWPSSSPARGLAARRAAALIEADRWEVRSFSTTLSLSYVAAGRFAGCILFEAPSVVHTAAGALLVAEAGGIVTDFDGRTWTLESSSLVCAATAELHQDLLRVLASVDAT